MRRFSRSRLVIAAAMACGLLLSTEARTQNPVSQEIASLLEALRGEFAARDAFAVDSRSIARALSEELDWELSSDQVEALLGPGFQYGGYSRFVACEGDQPCTIGGDGVHVEVVQATRGEDPAVLDLRLGLRLNEDRALTMQLPRVILRRIDGVWRLSDGGPN